MTQETLGRTSPQVAWYSDLHGISLGIAFYTGQGMGLNDNDRDVYGLLTKTQMANTKILLYLARPISGRYSLIVPLNWGGRSLNSPG
jgi:hypothetical protein